MDQAERIEPSLDYACRCTDIAACGSRIRIEIGLGRRTGYVESRQYCFQGYVPRVAEVRIHRADGDVIAADDRRPETQTAGLCARRADHRVLLQRERSGRAHAQFHLTTSSVGGVAIGMDCAAARERHSVAPVQAYRTACVRTGRLDVARNGHGSLVSDERHVMRPGHGPSRQRQVTLGNVHPLRRRKSARVQPGVQRPKICQLPGLQFERATATAACRLAHQCPRQIDRASGVRNNTTGIGLTGARHVELRARSGAEGTSSLQHDFAAAGSGRDPGGRHRSAGDIDVRATLERDGIGGTQNHPSRWRHDLRVVDDIRAGNGQRTAQLRRGWGTVCRQRIDDHVAGGLQARSRSETCTETCRIHFQLAIHDQ